MDKELIDQINAVVLSGGSAFGLSACSGVMEFLEEANIGFNTSAGKVPIVVGLSLFDLGSGSSTVRPGHQEGKEAGPTGFFISQWRDEWL